MDLCLWGILISLFPFDQGCAVRLHNSMPPDRIISMSGLKNTYQENEEQYRNIGK
jgi:hypothetical protein